MYGAFDPRVERVQNQGVDACAVTVTAGSEEEAQAVTDALLDARLAACVQIGGPVTSHYWWQGRRETASEWVCLVKTRQSLLDEVVAAVRTVHSYDVPEIVATPITGGDAAYLDWLMATASGRGGL